MLQILFLVGIFVSTILAIFNYRKNLANIYLSLFFFSISIYSVVHYVLFSSKSVTLVALFFSSDIGFITLLIGPMLFFYTRSIVTDKSNFKRTDVWHLIPIGIFFISGIPHLFMPWAQKLQFASEYLNNNKVLVSEFSKSTNSSTPFLVMFFFRPVYILTYLAGSVGLFVKHLRLRKQSHVFYHQKFMYSWLTILYALMLILIVSHTAILYNHYITNSPTINNSIELIQTVSLFGLIGLMFSPFLYPSILYGLPQIKTMQPIKTSEPDSLITTYPDEDEQNDDKIEFERKELKLEEAYLNSIDILINSSMRAHQPYLNPDFNMAMLSVLINIPVHHLHYYFKEIKKQSFTEFRNYLRIEYAKKMILEGKSKNFTLEAIASQSGFSSRNTFLVSFKKNENMTPKEFLGNLKN
ncbi:MAG: helix-turn-helix domain-containing protein [Mariniphaga sp.]